MNEECETYQVLVSGYLDGELGAAEREKLEAHLETCETCRKEFEETQALVSATAKVRIEDPPEEVWDTFLDNVYNRMERRFGWFLAIAGLAVWACIGLYLFVTEPWGSALEKFFIALPVVGLTVVFVSVLRQRLVVAKTDRYSKDVHR